jgi:hypothetical protein
MQRRVSLCEIAESLSERPRGHRNSNCSGSERITVNPETDPLSNFLKVSCVCEWFRRCYGRCTCRTR